MRTLRLILYFVLGLAFGGVVTLAHAETIAATATAKTATVPPWLERTYGWMGTSPTAICGAIITGGAATIDSNGNYTCTKNGTEYGTIWKAGTYWNNTARCWNPDPGKEVACTGYTYTCPDASWTLNGTNCTRADTCVAADLGAAYYKLPISSPDGSGTYCESGCEVSLAGVVPLNGDPDPPPTYDDGVSIWKWYVKSRGTTKCTASNAAPGPITGSPTDPVKSPPCASGEGVLTSSTGKVYCVPASTSTTKPIVNSSSKTDTYDDGSTTTTNITQTCTGAGACSTTTTTTNTSATGGGTGKAGTPGTTTSTKDDKPSDTSEFCAKNPNLQMCKGGMAEEGTQKQVLSEVKKLTSVDANTDKTAITNTSKYSETPGYQAAKDADDNLVKYASGVTKNADVEASKTTFEQALSSGFWTDIPTASCTTPTYVIAGHAIEWSRWCEIVGYIQEIGAYGMWIMLAISVFVMLTGGRQT